MGWTPEVRTVSNTIRAAMTPLGPVHVRLTSIVRGDSKGPGIAIVNAPTAAEATAELHRVARVSGADKVVSVAADYRRAALAGGTTSTQWRIEVQAWGTAMVPVKVEPSQEPQDQRAPEADKARDQEAAKKAQDARADAQQASEQATSRAAAAAADEQAAAQRVEPVPQATASSPDTGIAAASTSDSPSLPSAPTAPER